MKILKHLPLFFCIPALTLLISALWWPDALWGFTACIIAGQTTETLGKLLPESANGLSGQ